MKSKRLRWLWTAFACCVLYLVAVWLLNADFVGIELMLRLRGTVAAIWYWSVFVVIYAGLAMLLLIGISYLTAWVQRKT